MSQITVQLTRTPGLRPQPVICLNGEPFYEAEFSPARARRIAALLIQLADSAELVDVSDPRWWPESQVVEA
ncbi:hypothetical protein ACMHYJ_02155 [Castellaniella hirudinis]|uniref:hypothetical protein n=1 Tax=Castellaniella hirudinis TaxID=1144617 RepID=UPI0039C30262